MTISANKLNQSKDIAGSRNQDSSLDVTNEPLKLGTPVSGQNGTTASISGTAPDIVVSGLSGLTSASTCRYLTLSGADFAGNNGTFQITEVLSATSAVITNASGVAGDANNGLIAWIERRSYSLEDDLNYARSDRANIKGVGYDEPVPTYVRCIDQFTEIPANLANIAGKTTDSKAFVDNLKFQNVSVTSGSTFATLTSTGNLKHADSVNITGVPINDGYDAGNYEAIFVGILKADGYETELTVLEDQTFAQKGWRIFGITRAGSSVSPDSVEIEFRAIDFSDDLSSSVEYIWENDQPNNISVIIGYRSCLNSIDEAAFRKLLLFGNIYGGTSNGINDTINASNVIVNNSLTLSNSLNLQSVLEDLDGYLENHNYRHEFGGEDQIDGYNVFINYLPINYNTPSQNTIGSHIASIDEALANTGSSNIQTFAEFALSEDVYNTTRYFFAWRATGTDSSTGKRSGSGVGLPYANACSPYQVPFDATIKRATLSVRGVGVQSGFVTYPVFYQANIVNIDFNSETILSTVNFSISSIYTVGVYSVANTYFKGFEDISIDVEEGDFIGIRFQNGFGPSLVGQTSGAFISLLLEKR